MAGQHVGQQEMEEAHGLFTSRGRQLGLLSTNTLLFTEQGIVYPLVITMSV